MLVEQEILSSIPMLTLQPFKILNSYVLDLMNSILDVKKNVRIIVKLIIYHFLIV